MGKANGTFARIVKEQLVDMHKTTLASTTAMETAFSAHCKQQETLLTGIRDTLGGLRDRATEAHTTWAQERAAEAMRRRAAARETRMKEAKQAFVQRTLEIVTGVVVLVSALPLSKNVLLTPC